MFRRDRYVIMREIIEDIKLLNMQTSISQILPYFPSIYIVIESNILIISTFHVVAKIEFILFVALRASVFGKWFNDIIERLLDISWWIYLKSRVYVMNILEQSQRKLIVIISKWNLIVARAHQRWQRSLIRYEL